METPHLTISEDENSSSHQFSATKSPKREEFVQNKIVPDQTALEQSDQVLFVCRFQ